MIISNERVIELLTSLDSYLLQERGESSIELPQTEEELWSLFRALVNVREPSPAPSAFLAEQDELLKGLIERTGITAVADTAVAPLDARLRLWRGDITTLAADAIVNAANSQMLGCWVPGHHCIDNAIHTFAGVQLRRACYQIMKEQGHDEPTGQAKVTPAFNLPSSYVVHTVGPIVGAAPSAHQQDQLASCYTSCLDAASAHSCASIAFCCISTGVFGYPQKDAAQIAVNTVRTWLDAHPKTPITVVFNVFLESDERIYRALLGFD